MKTTSQHELHPDTEQLNAFAEQALGDSERDEMLRHLAVCGLCRQVVALARDAAVAEAAAGTAAPESQRRPIEANAWWKQWRLVWVPTTVLAAFAVTSIAFYMRQADQRETAIRIAKLTPDQGAEPALASPPADQLKPLPPAAPAPAALGSKAAKANPPGPERSAGERLKSAPMIAEKLTPPPQQLPASPLPAPQLPAQESFAPGLAGGGFMAGNRPNLSQPPASAQLQAEKKEQEERQQSAARVLHGAMFAAKASAPPSEHNEPRNATEQVAVTAEELEMQPAPIPRFETLQAGVAPAVADAMSAIRLPSSLPAISMVIAGKTSLAIDKAGALFISQDEGGRWDRVPQQWTGRAVLIRRQTAPPNEASQQPDAKKQAVPAGAASAAPLPIFEIVNDQSDVWWSTDGRTWTAK